MKVSPDRLLSLIKRLRVESNPHYQPLRAYGTNPGTTYCNIFAADVANNTLRTLSTIYSFQENGAPDHHLPLGFVPLLRRLYPLPPQLEDGRWLNTKRMIQWLRGEITDSGPDANARGWRGVGRSVAVQIANRGFPVIVGCVKDDEGHMAILKPGNLISTPTGNLRIAQAGRINFSDGFFVEGFSTGQSVEFFAYVPRGFRVDFDTQNQWDGADCRES